MRIAFIGQKGIPVISGGVERRVEELSTRMANAGHEVFVYARKDYIASKISQYKGVNLVYLPVIPTKNLSAISHTFLATLHALFQNYDVVHYQAPGPSSLSWIIKFLRPKTALIATFNSQDFKHQKWSWFARFYLKLGEWVITRVPDKTIVVSKLLKKNIEKSRRQEIVVIHNGASVKNPALIKNSLLQLWQLEKKKYFLSVSRLVRHKGIHYLIEAFNNAQQKGKIPGDFKLVIVGDSAFTNDYVAYLKKLSRTNPNIIFTGNQASERLAQLYAHAYAFVQPSEAEGLSNSLLEAMGYGLAPIISDIPENVLPVKKNGLIFQNKNTKDLEQKLSVSIEQKSLVSQMGANAKQHVEKNYSWEENVSRTLKLYQEVLAKKMPFKN